MATLSSMNSIPAAAQVSTSSAEIGREASETSVSPAQNWANPSPVPGPVDRHRHAGIQIGERIADRDRDRLHRRRAGDDDAARQVATRRSGSVPSLGGSCRRRAGSVASARGLGDVVVGSVSSLVVVITPQAAKTRDATIAIANSRLEEKFTLLAPFSRDMTDVCTANGRERR